MMRRIASLTVALPCLLVLLCSTLSAADDPKPSAPVAESSPAPAAEVDETVPVPVPEASPLAMEYYRTGMILWFLTRAWGILVLCALLFLGVSARIRTLASKIGRFSFLTIPIYGVLYLIFAYLIDLPLDYYLGYVRLHAYGLSNQTFAKWLDDGWKGLLVSCIAAALLLWIPYLLLAKAPKRWWIYLALLTVPFGFLTAMIKPIWIDPLFNDFGPMKNKALESKIRLLADRAGIEGGRILEVEKSKDTKTVNAYVTGFLDTKRIVLWDTLLEKLDEREVLVVMGHEMGHYALNHVVVGITLGGFGSLFMLYLVHRLSGAMIDRFKDRFGFDSLADVASVPLLILILDVIGLVGAPIGLAFSRWMEHEADRFALELTHANHSAASAFSKLQRENLANPRPDAWTKYWRMTHPPIGERMDFCNNYHPWRSGEPTQYEAMFRAVNTPP